MHEKMLMMAARNKKMPRAKAKGQKAEGAKECGEIVRSPDAPSPKRSLPKVKADRICEDDLTDKEELAAIMKLEEISLRKFLEDEPDIYTLDDLKVRYK